MRFLWLTRHISHQERVIFLHYVYHVPRKLRTDRVKNITVLPYFDTFTRNTIYFFPKLFCDIYEIAFVVVFF